MAQESFDAALERAIEIAGRNRQALLRYPGVVAVGAGPERRKGVLTGQAAIIVTVREKLSQAELKRRNQARLPVTLEGIPVDVVALGQPVEAEAIRAAQARAAGVLEQVRAEWLAQPNVTGMGVGYKVVGGERTDQIALLIFVERKLPAVMLNERNLRPVPPTLSGVPTDVIELPRLVPQASSSGSRADRKDPLVGGISIGTANRPFWRGTLGAIVFDRTTGAQRILSNEHVLDGAIGEDVIQPAPVGLDDSIEVGFQLNICNPTRFFRLDTPNTTLGTILAGATIAAAVAAALSDEIDPTRRGQEATVPPPGALTVAEQHSVRMDYPELPIPGTPFQVHTKWTYTRETTAGDFSHTVEESQQNPHRLRYKGLFTDRALYHPGDKVHLLGVLVPLDEPHRKPCGAFHPVGLLTPTKEDRLFPVVLREAAGKARIEAFSTLLNILVERDPERAVEIRKLLDLACLYTGSFTVGQGVPVGPWRHYLYVQTVNNVPAGVKPEVAAQTIGGLPVSQNMKPVLDVACGPFVFEDGTFDIELI